LADRPVVICLDELPIMVSRLLKTSEQDAEIFLSWLRLVMGMYQERLGFIICGSIGLEPILKRHGLSHTIAHLQTFHLDGWERTTARKCLDLLATTSGLKWQDDVPEKMLDYLGAYIPHHVQMFFGLLYAALSKQEKTKPCVEDVDVVYKNSMLSARGHAELADYEERLLRVLPKETIPLALDILTEAAMTGLLKTEPSRLIAERFELPEMNKALREVMDLLEHDGYILWNEDSNGWKFSSRLVRDWWKRRFSQSYQPVQ
jgi:hypothetical protein